MTRYEVVFIVHPDRTDEEARKVVERLGEVVAREGGEVIKVEEWGKRKLAYKVQKQFKGIYFLVQFAGNGRVVSEVERMLRISDDVLKYLTVSLEEEVALATAGASGGQGPRPTGEGASGAARRSDLDADEVGEGESESAAVLAGAESERELG